jgi:hypothetical protein
MNSKQTVAVVAVGGIMIAAALIATLSTGNAYAFFDRTRGGNGGIGGAGGAGGVGGNGGVNVFGIDQDANGGSANGAHGGNAPGGNACHNQCGANS